MFLVCPEIIIYHFHLLLQLSISLKLLTYSKDHTSWLDHVTNVPRLTRMVAFLCSAVRPSSCTGLSEQIQAHSVMWNLTDYMEDVIYVRCIHLLLA